MEAGVQAYSYIIYCLTMRKIFLLPMVIVLSLISCSGKQQPVVERKNLFRLSMGKAEDQIDLIQLPGVPFKQRSRIIMKEGLFYISNGNTGKIMEFTSYGDIISLYYNPEMNPPPIFLTTASDTGTVSNRKAFSYPFNNIGEIEVSDEGELLVDDEVPAGRVERDDKTGSVLDRIILRFSKKGDLTGYLGQEGPGGTPFPYIEKLEVNDSGSIIVFTRTVKSRIIYWFSREGTLFSTVTILLSDLPVPDGKSYIAFLDSITADRVKTSLYLKIDYYETQKDGSTGYRESEIWELSALENRYTASVAVPSVYTDYGNTSEKSALIDDVYEFLGCDKSGRFYFIVHLNLNTFQLLILSADGTVLAKSDLDMDDSAISYSSFYLTEEGLLTALLAKENTVDIVWWRSDKLTGAGNVQSN